MWCLNATSQILIRFCDFCGTFLMMKTSVPLRSSVPASFPVFCFHCLGRESFNFIISTLDNLFLVQLFCLSSLSSSHPILSSGYKFLLVIHVSLLVIQICFLVIQICLLVIHVSLLVIQICFLVIQICLLVTPICLLDSVLLMCYNYDIMNTNRTHIRSNNLGLCSSPRALTLKQ